MTNPILPLLIEMHKDFLTKNHQEYLCLHCAYSVCPDNTFLESLRGSRERLAIFRDFSVNICSKNCKEVK